MATLSVINPRSGCALVCNQVVTTDHVKVLEDDRLSRQRLARDLAKLFIRAVELAEFRAVADDDARWAGELVDQLASRTSLPLEGKAT